MNLVGRLNHGVVRNVMPKDMKSGGSSIDQIATKIAVLQDQEYQNQIMHLLRKITTFDFATRVFGDIHFRMNVFLLEIFRQFNDVLGVRLPDYETGGRDSLHR